MPNYMKPDSRIYIAGHRGLVGSAIHRALDSWATANILTRTRMPNSISWTHNAVQ